MNIQTQQPIIKAKEALTIINSLQGGVVPSIGLQHILVGRSYESRAILETLDQAKEGHSSIKFWIGDFGSGKSFMMSLIKQLAIRKNFVVGFVDFSPEKRLYANDKKALRTYSDLINSLTTSASTNTDSLGQILDTWAVDQLDLDPSFSDLAKKENLTQFQSHLLKLLKPISGTGSFEFVTVVIKYAIASVTQNDITCRLCLKWLKGEFSTKIEAKNDLGVSNIIKDEDLYSMIKNLSDLFVILGYSGFVVNFDEAINLYKIIHPQTRDKNYEKILEIYNDCMQGRSHNLLINFGGTKDFLEDNRRGLFSYHALKSRLETNKFETNEIRDYSQPVIRLAPLSHEEIYVLLCKLKEIFEQHYVVSLDLIDRDIHFFMEEVYNRPGSKDFLTPRDVIRDYLKILNILRQNPSLDKLTLIKNTDGGNSKAIIEREHNTYSNTNNNVEII
jgi:P-loop Domain of unknown function (DUF2791)